MSNLTSVLVDFPETLEFINATLDVKRPDYLRRFPITGSVNTPVRISAELRTEGVTGVPGLDCSAFFNLEYADGPIFWDMFLYPDTGSTPWRTLSCEARARGVLSVVEMHIRFIKKGKFALRNLRVATIPPWYDDADVNIAVFGDSTDMSCQLTTEHRPTRHLELLLRDRFPNHRVDVHGFAEGGEYVQRLLESGRLDRELRTMPNCDIVMVRFGLNDRGRKIEPQLFGQQLHTVCDIILKRHPATKILLNTTFPPHAGAYDEQTLAVAAARHLAVIRVDEMLRQRSAAGDSDWHNEPGSCIGRRRTQNPPDNPTGLLGDLHPNVYGAQMLAELYAEQLEPIVAGLLKVRPTTGLGHGAVAI